MSAGRAWIFGDNVDTDALAPGLWMKFGIEEIAKHCLEGLDPAFARDVRPGDVLVAGENFGMGSSREQAPAALRQLGIAAVVAKSFAGLFFRNCVNLGLAPLECADAGRIRAGDTLAVDPIAGRIENRTTGETLACEPIPPHLAAMIADGGLLPHLAKNLATRRSVLAGALALATLGASAASVAQIVRTTLDGEWRVIDAEGRLPAPETRWSPPTLRFDTASGRLSGTSGVNSLTAALVVEDETLRLGPPAMTKRAGPQPAMEFENAMLGALQRATMWRIDGPTLTLSDAGGMPLLRLEPAP